MIIEAGLALLLRHEEELTGYSSPVPVGEIDLQAVETRISDMELDFFDPEKSEIGNSIGRYKVLCEEQTALRGIISQVEYYRQFGRQPLDIDD